MKKVLSFCLAAFLFFICLPAAHAVTRDQYYARSTLSGSELAFYDQVYDAFKSGGNQVSDQLNLSSSRARQIGNFVYNDAPELFNYRGIYTREETEELNEQLARKSQEILSRLNGTMSGYQKTKAIYDYLGQTITYDSGAEAEVSQNAKSQRANESQTIVGGLLRGRAVCNGISHSLQYILHQAGVPCYTVTGTLPGVNHAWNIIRLNGQWYNADLTNDLSYIRQSQEPRFFLVDDATLTQNAYVADQDLNPSLPACAAKYIVQASPAAAIATAAPTQTPSPSQTAPAVQKAASALTAVPLFIWAIAAVAAIAAIAIVLAVLRRNKKQQP